MKKSFKKTLVGVVFVMLICIFCFGASAEEANDYTYYTEGYYTYTIYNGEAWITDVDEKISGDVAIPKKLGGYPVTEIISFAFSECVNIDTIEIHEGIDFIDYDSFGVITLGNITEFRVDEKNSYYTNDEYGVLFNKDKTILLKYPCGNRRTSYSIPESTTCIVSRAFSGAQYLESITIPDSVIEIGYRGFEFCYSLQDIKIPDDIIALEDMVFYQCKGLKSVSLPEGLRTIGYSVFNGCIALNGVVIPDGVTEIGTNAFDSCESLTEIVIPDGVVNIEDDLFWRCVNLKSVTIPEGVEFIADRAFFGCKSLENILIPDSVISIGQRAFSECESLREVSISENVENIGNNAFTLCKNLEAITVDKDNVFYSSDENGSLFNKSKSILIQYPIGNDRASYTIPEEVDILSDYAFYGCENLTDVVIANKKAERIGIYTFSNCENIKNITIPYGVKNIDYGAFEFCFGLNDVYYGGTKSEWEKIEIDEVNNWLLNANIHFHVHKDADGNSYCDECGRYFEHCFKAETKNATCTDSGYSKVYCYDCGYVESYDEYAATGHNYQDDICVNCGAEKDKSSDCSHICHRSGISSLFYRIMCFFWKLFKMNSVCECGAAHY